MWLFALLILWPLAEIALFVTLGGWLGLGLTLGIVLGTAALGVMLLRGQAKGGAARLRKGGLQPLLTGGLTLTAGMLLILPGFLTDMLGLLLLLPPVQTLAMVLVARRMQVLAPAARRAAAEDVLEGNYTEVEGPPEQGGRPSGWTRH
jgi:UPF0716 protein FxsA